MSMDGSRSRPAGAIRLLVVEDEPDIGSLLDYVLGNEGFEVRLAQTGREAIDAIDEKRPDLVILDLMLPDMTGLEILGRLRRRYNRKQSYVIILSARKDEEDRVKGFELGADDYMIKPFSPRELVLRVRRALNRPEAKTGGDTSLESGPIAIDLEQHEARIDGKPVHLTLTEFRLLADLVRNRGRVRTREALMTEVWGYDSRAMSRTVDTHVRRLRYKLGDAAAWLDTVRGVGYRFRDPGSDSGRSPEASSG